jgi:RNA polymerase sigma-70 factor (ECF subfamily)
MDLKALFLAHEREVGAFLRRRVGVAADAADLSQEAFLRLAGRHRSEAVEDPRGFLFTVAANLARDHLRRFVRRQRVEADPADDTLVCPAATPEEALRDQQQRCVLSEAIDRLPERTRRIFLLYHIEGCSYREIAERMAVSPRTVEYHLRQALDHCRKHARRAGAL